MTDACEEQLFHLQCKDPNKKNKNQTKQQKAAAGLQWKQQGEKVLGQRKQTDKNTGCLEVPLCRGNWLHPAQCSSQGQQRCFPVH